MIDLEVEADRLLAQVAQDPEYPFRTEGQMSRRAARSRHQGAPPPVMVVGGTTPEEWTLTALDRQIVLQRAELTSEERCCLLLYVQYELSDDEIGELVGKHRNTVRDRRAIAYRKVRQAVSVLAPVEGALGA